MNSLLSTHVGGTNSKIVLSKRKGAWVIVKLKMP